MGSNNQSANDPFLNNLFVFAASEDGYLYALDATDGSVKWKFQLTTSTVRNAQFSSPTYADSTIYIGSTDQNIYAINAYTGKERWHFLTSSANGYFYASPVIANGTLYVGGYETGFYAIDAKTGQLKWKRNFPREFESSPTYANNTVFTSTNDGILYALNAIDGSTKWSIGGTGYNWGLDYGHTSPLLKDSVLFALVNDVSASKTYLNELNPLDGTAFHGSYSNYQVNSLMANLSSPALDDSIIYFAGLDSTLHAIKRGDSMSQIWSFKAGNIISSSPASDTGAVYFGCNDGILYAINKRTGALRWKFESMSTGIVSSPVVVNGAIFFGAEDAFFAVSPINGRKIWNTPNFMHFSSSPCVLTKNGIAFHSAISGMNNK